MKSEEGVRVIACFWRRVEPVLGGDTAEAGEEGGGWPRRRYVINLSSGPQNKRQTPRFDLSGPVQQTVS